MKVNEFLSFIEQHPFILYYYAFSMILSILLGRFFLSQMGYPRIWNYFFSLLLYVMSVFGIISLIVYGYKLIIATFTIPWYEVLIPFFTMILAIIMIRNRVSISLLTGFGHFSIFFIGLFLLALLLMGMDYLNWWHVLDWPMYLFFLFLVIIMLVLQQILRLGSKKGFRF